MKTLLLSTLILTFSCSLFAEDNMEALDPELQMALSEVPSAWDVIQNAYVRCVQAEKERPTGYDCSKIYSGNSGTQAN